MNVPVSVDVSKIINTFNVVVDELTIINRTLMKIENKFDRSKRSTKKNVKMVEYNH
jgi:hypothetical protein